MFFPIHLTHATETPPSTRIQLEAYEEDTEHRLGFGKAQTLVSILDFLWDLEHYPPFCTCTVKHVTTPPDWKDIIYY